MEESKQLSNKLYISNQAVEDLEDIWDYIANDNVKRADAFLDKLYTKCLELSELKGVGRSRDDLLPALKSFPYKKYIIFFYRTELEINISRILHSGRDISRIFGEES